jgi:hypothetical protein
MRLLVFFAKALVGALGNTTDIGQVEDMMLMEAIRLSMLDSAEGTAEDGAEGAEQGGAEQEEAAAAPMTVASLMTATASPPSARATRPPPRPIQHSEPTAIPGGAGSASRGVAVRRRRSDQGAPGTSVGSVGSAESTGSSPHPGQLRLIVHVGFCCC